MVGGWLLLVVGGGGDCGSDGVGGGGDSDCAVPCNGGGHHTKFAECEKASCDGDKSRESCHNLPGETRAHAGACVHSCAMPKFAHLAPFAHAHAHTHMM